MFSEVTSTDRDIVSLNRLRRRVLNPFPENGTQNKSTFQTNASGTEAGRKPDEKERALAVVTEESIQLYIQQENTDYTHCMKIATTT